MQTYETEIGMVTTVGGMFYVTGTHDQLYAWAHRLGAAWPCSTLTDYDRVSATFSPSNGDLLDLTAYDAGMLRPCDDPDIAGDEFTAWSSDVLTACPWAKHLAKVTA